MIAFFPDAYPDELLYSRICRYHVYSGNYCSAFTMDELYGKRTVHPDIEFLNRFTKDALDWICGDDDLKTVIMKQTMFPFYARFLPKERRLKALSSLLVQEPVFYNHLAIPQTGARYLRYCPACAEEDRALLGETYWHRTPQIQRIRVCPKHACFLANSEIRIASKTKPGLYDAESYVPLSTSVEVCSNEREIEFTKYLLTVGEHSIDFETEMPVSIFLHDKLGEYFTGKSRLIVDMDRLYADYSEFFADMEKASFEVFRKIVNAYSYDVYFLLSVAFFLRISVEDITSLPKQPEFHGLEKLYSDLAKKYNIDFSIVSAIGKEVQRFLNSHSYARRHCGIQAKNWARLDDELLPMVQAAVTEVINTAGRPQKLSVTKIQKKLGLPQKHFDNLPQCKKYILEHMETQPEYWSREIEWAVAEIKAKDLALTRTRIQDLLNIRQTDLESSLPFIKDENVKEVVSRLLEGK